MVIHILGNMDQRNILYSRHTGKNVKGNNQEYGDVVYKLWEQDFDSHAGDCLDDLSYFSCMNIVESF